MKSTKRDSFLAENFVSTTTRANAKVSTTAREGGGTAILTNVFLEKMRNNMENLSNTKVSNMTKCCLKNLVRVKNEMRARKK